MHFVFAGVRLYAAMRGRLGWCVSVCGNVTFALICDRVRRCATVCGDAWPCAATRDRVPWPCAAMRDRVRRRVTLFADAGRVDRGRVRDGGESRGPDDGASEPRLHLRQVAVRPPAVVDQVRTRLNPSPLAPWPLPRCRSSENGAWFWTPPTPDPTPTSATSQQGRTQSGHKTSHLPVGIHFPDSVHITRLNLYLMTDYLHDAVFRFRW